MLDVHAPHEKIHGFWDFSLHLFTITIGLLIALSLESCVEWRHQRNLVHDAETAIRGEITENQSALPLIRRQRKDQEKVLDKDLAALAIMRQDPKVHAKMAFGFQIVSLDDLAWKTAQTTGASSYMPYKEAEQFSNIYLVQDGLYKVQEQITEDSMAVAAPVINLTGSQRLNPQQIEEVTERIGLIKMRMLLLDSYLKTLDDLYQKYQTAHPHS